METLCQSRDLKDLPNEIWKPIEGYEDIYEISNYGRVKSLDKYINHYKGGLSYRKKLILKHVRIGRKDQNRPAVSLGKDGTLLLVSINRLVYSHFMNDIDNSVILVKDGNTRNTHISNLFETSIEEHNQQVGHNYQKETKHEKCKNYVGVRLFKKCKTYSIGICVENKQMYFGGYKTPEEAARAYDTYIIKNGLNRKTNFDRSLYSNII